MRRQAWHISDSWSVDQLRSHIQVVKSNGSWELLRQPADVAELDRWMRCHLDCEPKRHRRYVSAVQLSVDDIANKMNMELPTLTRPQLRTLLHRATRKGIVTRVSRGRYEETREHESFERLIAEYDDPSYERWKRLHDRNKLVLLAHYLLHHLPAYRKARQLGLSDRAYFYALNEGLEPLAPEDPDEFPRNVQW